MKLYKKDQHFLIDKKIINRIIEYGDLKNLDTVLEIGAGYGNLTRELARKAGRVIAVEIDQELASSLSGWDNVDVVKGDALKIEFPYFNKVISNLPYSISSPITFKLLRHKFAVAILMYQHEFARRLVALPGSKDYSRLSIGVQYYADVEILEKVPPSAFSSPPEVSSAIVRLTPRPPLYEVSDREFFMKFLKAAFYQRRKKLRNAILNNAALLGIEDMKIAMEKLPQIMIERRAETISPEGLAGLSDILAAWKKQNLK